MLGDNSNGRLGEPAMKRARRDSNSSVDSFDLSFTVVETTTTVTTQENVQQVPFTSQGTPRRNNGRAFGGNDRPQGGVNPSQFFKSNPVRPMEQVGNCDFAHSSPRSVTTPRRNATKATQREMTQNTEHASGLGEKIMMRNQLENARADAQRAKKEIAERDQKIESLKHEMEIMKRDNRSGLMKGSVHVADPSSSQAVGQSQRNTTVIMGSGPPTKLVEIPIRGQGSANRSRMNRASFDSMKNSSVFGHQQNSRGDETFHQMPSQFGSSQFITSDVNFAAPTPPAPSPAPTPPPRPAVAESIKTPTVEENAWKNSLSKDSDFAEGVLRALVACPEQGVFDLEEMLRLCTLPSTITSLTDQRYPPKKK